MTDVYEMTWPILDPSTPFSEIIRRAETDIHSALNDYKRTAKTTTTYRVEVKHLRWHLYGIVELEA